MKITIITVSFNSAATISDTLRSVAKQSYADLEHIVIDGGSTDGTVAIVSREGDHIAKFVSEPDRGIYDAMNKGLALATGDVIGFLNSDDMFFDSKSAAIIAAAFESSDVDAIFGDLLMVDPKNLDRVRRYWRPGPHHAGGVLRGWLAPHPTLYVRRSVLRGSGGFNTIYKLQADFDLELRLFELMKIRSLYVPQTLVLMRMGGVSTGNWRNVIRGNLEAARAARSHGYPGGIRFLLTKLLSRVPQFLSRPKHQGR